MINFTDKINFTEININRELFNKCDLANNFLVNQSNILFYLIISYFLFLLLRKIQIKNYKKPKILRLNKKIFFITIKEDIDIFYFFSSLCKDIIFLILINNFLLFNL